MGSVHPNIPFTIAETLRNRFGISNFVETGTYLGDTSSWAAERFNNVWTIEAHRPLYERAVERFKGHDVQVLFGESSRALASIIPKLDSPCLFWLDAHYSGDGTAGAHYECPIFDEIALINTSPLGHFVLIDDARMFLTPPPPPHRPDHWPNIDAVIEALTTSRSDAYVTIFEDVIYRIPIAARRQFEELTGTDKLKRDAFLRATYTGVTQYVWVDKDWREHLGMRNEVPSDALVTCVAGAEHHQAS